MPKRHEDSRGEDDNKKTEAISSARHLLERIPHEDYLHEWTDVLKKSQDKSIPGNKHSVVVFRLGREWFALATIYFKEVTQQKTVHHIPHRSGKILLGIVNLDGELQLCVALNELLGVQKDGGENQTGIHAYNRMIALSKDKELWVFPVDEIDGVYLCDPAELENIPVNLSKSSTNYLKGIMTISNRNIGLLDDELIFYSLKRSLM